jgi:hypothetical protein
VGHSKREVHSRAKREGFCEDKRKEAGLVGAGQCAKIVSELRVALSDVLIAKLQQ